MNEAKLHADFSRGARAQSLLENELLTEAFEQLEKAYVERWRASHIDDATGREKLFLAVNVVGKVKDHLLKIMSDGSLAKTELDLLAKEADRKKRFGII